MSNRASFGEKAFAASRFTKEKEYWLKKLGGSPVKTGFGLESERIIGESHEARDSVTFNLSGEICEKLLKLSLGSDYSLFIVLVAVVVLLLEKYTGNTDILVGTTIYRQKVAGDFLNTILVLRNDTREDMTFKELLLQVKQTAAEANENRNYPVETLVFQLGMTYSEENFPLFDAAVLLENIQDRTYLQPLRPNVLFIFERTGTSLAGIVEYNSLLLEKGRVKGLTAHFQQVLCQVLVDVNLPLCDIGIMTEAERKQIMDEFNDTAAPLPQDTTLHLLFEDQVKRSPDAVALVGPGCLFPAEDRDFLPNFTITYGELSKNSGHMAALLQQHGVVPQDAVAVMIDRSVEMVTGLIAILKAGAAYLPIAPEYPADRKRYMIRDSDAKIVLSTRPVYEKQGIPAVETVFMEKTINKVGARRDVPGSSRKGLIQQTLKTIDLAYIIYTSGTTGFPKGVMVEHRSAVNVVTWFGRQYELHPGSRVLLLSDYTFDASVNQVFGTLLHGATLFIITKSLLLDMTALRLYIETEDIHLINFVPQLLKELLGEGRKLACIKTVISGAEKLDNAVKDIIRGKGYTLINHYGPTEATVDALALRCSADPVSLGKPVANTQCFILNKYGQLLPRGIVGELVIAGAGVARGYLNRPELTAEKFTLSTFELSTYRLFYKTGDLCMWQADGSIRFLGRLDNQVKIRGYRIELTEIENQLMRHPDVKQAVVIAGKKENGETYLFAYIVPQNTEPVGKSLVFAKKAGEWREFLSLSLPDYMIPSNFIPTPNIPLTPAGKVDRRALPEPEFAADQAGYIPPATPVQKQLAEVWQHVLAVEKIGMGDNFFEVGGDSIKAIRIAARLKKYRLNLKINDLFLHPTIAELVKNECITVIDRDSNQGIVSGEIPLTPIQSAFFRENSPNMNHYNQSVMVYRKEGFNEAFLVEVLTGLVTHHDALRMVYEKRDETVVQVNRDNSGTYFDLQVFDFTAQRDFEKKIEKEAGILQASLDIYAGQLLKSALFKTAEGDHLLIIIHHLVVDGVSWRILFEDINTAYGQLSRGEKIRLPLKTDSFQYWSVKLNEYAVNGRNAAGSELFGELKYWKEVETAHIKPLPRDYEIGSGMRKAGYRNTVNLELTEEETETLLKRVNWAYNTEINDILLCALGLTIEQWAGLETTALTLEGHGREAIFPGVDISRTVGWFTTRYPVILKMGKPGDLSYRLRHVKETLRRIPNKGIGYGILKYLAPEEKKEGLFRNREPGINFNYLGQFDLQSHSQDTPATGFFRFSTLDPGKSRSPEYEIKTVLDIGGLLVNGKLNLSFSYNRHEYKSETVTELAELYKANLLKIIDHCAVCEEKKTSPADFGCSHLSLEEFDDITGFIKGHRGEDAKIQSIYSLSPMQSGMLYHSMSDPKSAAYFEQALFTLTGYIDKTLLERSFNRLIDRYNILRTVFVYEGLTQPLQVVLQTGMIRVNEEQIETLSETEKQKFIEDYRRKERDSGFALSKDMLLRVSLFKVDAAAYKLLWSFHHILMDGWCMGIIYNELMRVYQSLRSGIESELPAITPYKSYIRWLEKQDKEAGLAYWQHYLAGFEEQTGVPRRDRSPAEDAYEAVQYHLKLTEEISLRLAETARQNQVTVNTLFQTLWGLLLQQYNNTEDVVFGAVVSGRPAEIEGIEDMIGVFINTIPVRVRSRSREKEAFSTLLRTVGEEFGRSREYEYLTLAEIQARSEMKRNLIDHIMIFENYPIREILADKTESKLEFRVLHFEMQEQTNYSFNFVVIPGPPIHITFSYNSSVHETGVIENLSRHFENIAAQVAGQPGILIDDMEIITAGERSRVLDDFNMTERAFPGDMTINRLFEEQADKRADSIALVESGSGSALKQDSHFVSYRELNRRAGRIASLLWEKGVPRDRDTIVALILEQSGEMAAVLLGILKAAASYLPIDPGYPQERIRYMLADSAAKLVFTSTARSSGLENFKDRQFEEIPIEETGTVRHAVSGEEKKGAGGLAYVIYTSGSTGKPKGVFVEHHGVVNTLLCRKEEYDMADSDAALQLFSPAFDGFVTGFFTPLLSGARVVLLNEAGRKDVVRVKETIIKHKVTHFICIPVLFQGIMEHMTGEETSSLKAVTLAGDRLLPHALELAKEKNKKLKIFNEYGVTESSVMSTINRHLKLGERISIGKPVWNTNIYIRDKRGRLQPPGLWGELNISGVGLARGYLNRPELTAEKFVRSTFELSTYSLLYKTGDLARWLPDGNIEFLGRIDQQVKIRGFRIEPGEIESRILEHEGVKEAVVLAREDKSGELYLCAYIVGQNLASRTGGSGVGGGHAVPEEFPSHGGGAAGRVGLTSADIRQYLSHILPAYMVPSHFIYLDKIPLNPNGKIDRRALPGPEKTAITGEYTAPRNRTEAQLAEVWQEVLTVEKVGIDDNFFDLGGDSIKAIRIAARLKRYHFDLKINDLFFHHSIRELSQHGCMREVSRESDQGTVSGELPLTPIQAWFFENNFSDPHHFIQGVLLYNKQGFNENLMRRVFNAIVVHHDALRMVYEKQGDRIVQKNRNTHETCFDLKVFDFTGQRDVEKKIQKEAVNLKKSIDLAKGPLLKVALFKTASGDHLLVIVHHLVVDGVSWRILLEDMETLYGQLSRGEEGALPAKTDSFKYWAEKLRDVACAGGGTEADNIMKELSYWQESDKVRVDPLPRDYEIGNEQKKLKYIDSVGIELDRKNTDQLLKNVNRAYNTEINDILLCALGLALKEWSGHELVGINLEGHGRENIIEGVDISRTVGWFTTQYPVLLNMRGAGDVSYDIPFLKETLRRIPNKGIGFGILKYLVPAEKKEGYSFEREPEISFNYLGQFGGTGDLQREENAGEFQFSKLDLTGNETTEFEQKFALNISGMLLDGIYRFSFSYNPYEFKKERIEKLSGLYKSHLLRIIRHCVNREEKTFTPADFGCSFLSIENFNRITDHIKQNIGTAAALDSLYPLSPMQNGMLYHSLKDKGSFAYFQQNVFTLTGQVDKAILETALNRIIDRYDVLRTIFIHEGLAEPLQVVLKTRKLQLFYESVEHLSETVKNKYIEDFRAKEGVKGFDLSKDLLLAVSLFKVNPGSYKLVWNFHHILMDGWCVTIFYRELIHIYTSLVHGKNPELGQVTPYRTYIRWLEKQDKEAGLAYWQHYLAGFEEQTGVPRRVTLSAEAAYEAAQYHLKLTEEISLRLAETARQNQVTVNTLFQTLWGLLLQQYNNTEDVVFGAVVSGRPAEVEGIEDMIGLFINTIPVRVRSRSREKEGFSTLLRGVGQEFGRSREYEYLTLAEIQARSELGRNLIDHIMIFENYPIREILADEVGENKLEFMVRDFEIYEQTNYSFNFVVIPGPPIHITFSYNCLVHETGVIENLSRHFENMAVQVAGQPGILIDDMEIITAEEKSRVLDDFNMTERAFPGDMTINRLFDEQAKKSPDAVALVGPGSRFPTKGTDISSSCSITYGELAKNTGHMAGLLRQFGVAPDDIVAIMIDRSIEMVTGLLSILKSGAAYLPIAPDFPAERKQYTLRDSGAKLLLTTRPSSRDVDSLNGLNVEMIFIENTNSSPGKTGSRQAGPLNLCYVIYTSGTTGLPKGVMVEHRSAVNVVTWFGRQYGLHPGFRVLLMSDYTFDASVNQVFGTLLHGAALFIIAKSLLLDLSALRLYIETKDIHLLNFVPLLLKELLGEGRKLACVKTVISGAEKLDNAVKNLIREKGYNLVNHYGPTEATIDALASICSADPVNLGKPIDNAQCFILDKNYRLMPPGVVGELVIAGMGVARGYLNRPELTAEKFVRSTYRRSTFELSTYSLLYKTGDLAGWRQDGTIDFWGRIDNQVKIRGYRIESGEIENRLLLHPQVRETAVTACENKEGEKFLCAYIVTEKPSPSPAQLRDHLSGTLPDYMIPAYFVNLEKMPLNRNGKLDRIALPEPTLDRRKAYIAPRDDIEKKLARLWADVLKIENKEEFPETPERQGSVGITENFFELGGHSLKAVTLMTMIHKNFNVKIPLTVLFERPTIKGMAGYIREAGVLKYHALHSIEKKDYYCLSSAQKRIYVLQQIDEDSIGYNLPLAVLLSGEIDKEKLKHIFTKLIIRHESLRTSFIIAADEPAQRIHPAQHIEFKIGHFKKSEFPAESETDIIASFIRPFDLAQAPLIRAGLIELADREHILLVDMHHIITDGTSQGLLTAEFMKLYAGETLTQTRARYRDYSEWQNSEKYRRDIKQQEDFWLQHFSGDIPLLDLPVDLARPAIQSFAGKKINFALEREEAAGLNKIVSEQECTLFMLLFAIYNVFLAKISGQDDIVVGSPAAGRSHADLDQLIGMFVNTLSIRNFPVAEKTFITFLQNVKNRVLEAFENQDYQFEDLVEKIEVKRDAGRNPLFDVMFVLQNQETHKVDIPGVTISPYKYESGVAKFDLTLQAYETDGRILFSLEYAAKLFKEGTIKRYIGFFRTLVSRILENPDRKLGDMEIMSEAEKKAILFDFNDTATGYPGGKTIHSLFEEQAGRIPDHIALTWNRGESPAGKAGSRETGFEQGWQRFAISYRDLEDRAGRLARLLKKKGVESDMIVGILVERSPEMITGIIAILKAGGAYLPLEPDTPVKRKEYMMKDSCAKLLLVGGSMVEEIRKLRNLHVETIRVDDIDNHMPGNHNTPLPVRSSADLAYVIYTSGTTGKPKGNLTTHFNAVRVVKETNYIEINEHDRLLQLSNYAFDGSVFDIYGALLNGAALALVSREDILSIKKLSNLIFREKISLFFVTTALFNTLVDLNVNCLTYVRKILFGGERVSLEHSRKALAYLGKDRLMHVYGPTEATVYASFYNINFIEDYAVTIPIGSPLANTSIYILDKYLHPVPIGLKGEIYVAGDGLARGYLNSPELTAEKFILATGELSTYDRLYKSGDLARWLPDGNIEFLGRIDQQVKIRGFRIELGEIENRLLNHNKVKEAVVVDRTAADGEKYLCAYLVLEDGVKFTKKTVFVRELREYLAQDLPDFMIPPFYEILEELPLTANGKVDMRALPQPGAAMTGTTYSAAKSETEKKLVKIWARVLGLVEQQISIDADFFELGGHSLKATTAIAIIHKELDTKINLGNMFKNSTIRALAKLIRDAAKKEFTAIEPAAKKGYYHLSSAQRRLYVLQQMEPESTAYNIPAAFKLAGLLDPEKLESTFTELITRHEILRTSFVTVENEPVQKIKFPQEVDFKIEYHDIHSEIQAGNFPENSAGKLRNLVATVIQSFIHPFDLALAPLLRAGIIQIEKNEHILMVDIHHIISDGVSQAIVIDDFMHLYNGEILPPLRLQFKDYSEWQNDELQQKALKGQEEFWLKAFQQDIPVLNLPCDFPRPPVHGFSGSNMSFEIGEKETAALKKTALTQGVTLYMLFFALYNIFLMKLSSQDDIVVGTPVAARRHADLEKVVGMFVNTLALRNRIHAEKSFREFLEDIEIRTLAAFENQEFQYEDLVNLVYTNRERDVSRNPLFDVSFSLHNVDNSPGEIPGLKFFSYKFENNTAKFDLMLNGNESGEKMSFVFEYSDQLFKKGTIERFILYFKKIVRVLAAEPFRKLSTIEIITEAEKKQILGEFNDTGMAYPHDKTIRQLFEEQMTKTPDKIALIGRPAELTAGSGLLTYRELNKKSRQLALYLHKKGVTADTIAAVMLERSIEMMVAIFAVLQAGGAYLPISPGSPLERKLFMLRDSNTKVLLTSGALSKEVETFGSLGFETVFVENEVNKQATLRSSLTVGSSENPVYVIYTSGSTGNPKGVMIRHCSVINRLHWVQRLYPIGEQDVILQKTTFVFDVSVWELFWWSFHGASLCLLGVGEEKDPAALIKTITLMNITAMHFVPSMLGTFLEYCETVADLTVLSSLKQVFASGEALMPHQVEKFNKLIRAAAGTGLINLYGPTEATVEVSFYDCPPDEKIMNVPIGKPIDNIKLYIVDQDLYLQPPGVVGELCIAGVGLARGYLNRPELTAEKFIDNPNQPKRIRLYKTGDLAKWLPGGNIEFIGRIDNQVKIRGFRIELGEIENELLKHESIKEAVVLAREDQKGNKYLCAYLTTGSAGAEHQPVNSPGLRRFLSKNLPEYMIPAYFTILDKMPLTPNGKIDRKSLPAPEGKKSGSGSAYEAPQNEIETALVETWEEVLGRKPVGVKDNFFFSGGDSIKSIQVASRLNRRGYKLEVRDIFRFPRISELAARVKKAEAGGNEANQQPVTGFVPLTPIQVEFFSKLARQRHHYNQSVLLHAEEGFSEAAVRAVFSKLIEHHDALRMCYRFEKDGIVQTNLGMEQSISLRVVDFSSRVDKENIIEELELTANEIQSSIDLAEGPLLKLGLFHLPGGDRLLIVIHHLIVDGVSWRILFEDIALLLNRYRKGDALELPPKTTSFKSWAERLQRYADEESFLQEKPYWQQLESRAHSLPMIKRDFENGTNLMKDGRTLSFTLNTDDTDLLLTEVNRAFGTEINDILLTALGLSIKKSFGQNTVLIALEGHGREEIFKDPDIGRTVGWFTGLYPAVLDVSFRQNLARQIKEIKESLRQVPNKGIGYGILRYLTANKHKQEINFKAKPQILFNYLGQFDTDIEQASFRIAAEAKGNSISPEREREYDFDISGIVSGKQLTISISFSQKQYREKTILSLLDHYNSELKQIIEFCISREKQEFTPADLTYRKLSIDMLDHLQRQYPLEDVYPLSPMQEGLLFHALFDSDSSAYFEQVSFRVRGDFVAHLLQQSLHELVKRHHILRTLFIHEDLERPLQVVLREWKVPFYYEDLSGTFSPGKKEEFIRELKRKDRERSFNLSRDLLLRLAMIRLEEEEYELIWSIHHILIDGWSSLILFSEFFEIYSSSLDHRPLNLPRVTPYREYIRWVESRDRETALAAWREYLAGYEQSPNLSKFSRSASGAYKLKTHRLLIAEPLTGALTQLAKERRVTLNILFQCLWAVLLFKYNNSRDVCFGAVVSGRPPDVPGIEQMVGLFINTVPVRVRVEPGQDFAQLLERMQQDSVQTNHYGYIPLAEIQANSSLKEGAIDHIIVFQNFPAGVDKRSRGDAAAAVLADLKQADVYAPTNYNFNITVDPGNAMQIRFKYNALVFERDFVAEVARQIQNLMERAVCGDLPEIAKIEIVSDRDKAETASLLSMKLE